MSSISFAILSLPDTVTAILSITSKSASLRIVWILLIISRTNPSLISSGVRLVSITTVIPLSEFATNPSICVISIRRSSLVSSISCPATLSLRTPSVLSSSIALLPSSSERVFLMSLRIFPYFGPNVLSCGLKLYDVKSLTSSLYSTSFTLSSSAMIAVKKSLSFQSALMNILPIGCLFLILVAFLQARPITTASRTSSMLSSSSLSIHASLATGKSQRWTLSGALLSMLHTRFLYMLSVINGIIGADTLHSVTSVVYSVMYALILSCSIPLAQNLSRHLLTYQLESSSTKSSRTLAVSVIL